MQSWEPRSPRICHLQAEEPGELAVWFSLKLRAWECGGPLGSKDPRTWTCDDCEIWRTWGYSSSRKESNLALPLPFCSIWDLNGLDSACHTGESGISFTNPLTDTPRNNVLPVTWVSLNPVKLTHNINYHNSISHYYLTTSCLWHPHSKNREPSATFFLQDILRMI